MSLFKTIHLFNCLKRVPLSCCSGFIQNLLVENFEWDLIWETGIVCTLQPWPVDFPLKIYQYSLLLALTGYLQPYNEQSRSGGAGFNGRCYNLSSTGDVYVPYFSQCRVDLGFLQIFGKRVANFRTELTVVTDRS